MLSFEGITRQCERGIAKMSHAEALVRIGQLIEDAFDVTFAWVDVEMWNSYLLT